MYMNENYHIKLVAIDSLFGCAIKLYTRYSNRKVEEELQVQYI